MSYEKDLTLTDFETSQEYCDYVLESQDKSPWCDDDSSVWSNIDSASDSFWSESLSKSSSSQEHKVDLRVSNAELPRYDGLGHLASNIQTDTYGYPVQTLMANGRICVSQYPMQWMMQVPQKTFRQMVSSGVYFNTVTQQWVIPVQRGKDLTNSRTKILDRKL